MSSNTNQESSGTKATIVVEIIILVIWGVSLLIASGISDPDIRMKWILASSVPPFLGGGIFFIMMNKVMAGVSIIQFAISLYMAIKPWFT
jgi:hypothetical protein